MRDFQQKKVNDKGAELAQVEGEAVAVRKGAKAEAEVIRLLMQSFRGCPLREESMLSEKQNPRPKPKRSPNSSQA